MGSVRRATATVRTVFRCVASRNTQRVFYWDSLRLISNRACGQKSGSASLASHTPSGPNLLGENITLSSPPLEPRRLLLSVMRQKVGKDRSQRGGYPLGYPPPVLPSLAKPSCGPTPAELCKEKPNLRVPSGTAKDGRCCASRQAHPKARPRSPYDGRRHHPYGPDCCSKTAIVDRAPLRRPPRRAQLRCCSAGYGAVSEKEPRPTVSGRAPGKFFRFNSSLKRYISLLRRGARWFERTGLKPAGLRFRRGGAPKGRLIGLTGEKNCLCPRALGNSSVSTHR